MTAPVPAAVGTLASLNGGPATLTVPAPAGLVAGDLVVAFTFSYWTDGAVRDASTITPPAGFTLGGQAGGPGFGSTLYGLLTAWYTYAAGGETSWDFATTSSGFTGQAVLISGGATSGDPFSTADGFKGGWTDSEAPLSDHSFDIASFTPGQPDTLLIAFSYTASGFTYPAGWSELVTGTNVDSDVVSITWAADDGPADPTGTLTFDSSHYTAVLLADLPAPSAAAVPSGDATGSVTWSGSAVGQSVGGGSAVGSTAWAGAATGSTDRSGAATGVVTWTGTATAIRLAYLAGQTAASNGGHFVDQDGEPFFIKADSAWCVPAVTSLADMETYAAARAAQGFNTILMRMPAGVDNTYDAGYDGTTSDGIDPFVGEDITQFNSAYWNRMAAFADILANHGLTLVAFPTTGSRWGMYDRLQAAGDTAQQAYGAAIGDVFKDKPNVVWGFGEDYYDYLWVTGDPMMGRILTGIRSTGDTSPVLVELDVEYDFSDDPFWQGKAIGNPVYTYRATYEILENAWADNVGPVYIVETNYEHGNNVGGPGTTDLTLRRQIGWTLTGGGRGYVHGNEITWQGTANVDFFNEVNSDFATNQFNRMFAALTGRTGWQNLAPAALITSGQGTRPTTGTMDGGLVDPLESDYATAAVTPAKDLAAVYLPSARQITLDTALLGASPTVTQVDPANGATSTPTMTGGTIPDPGLNSTGVDSDWLYLITADVPPAGGGAGSATWTGAATGSTDRSGSGGGLVSWTGSAAGSTGRAGAAAGAVAWAGAATGSAPVVGGKAGTAAGAVSWTGAAAGASTHGGAADGATAWAAAATGSTARSGSASGIAAWTGSAGSGPGPRQSHPLRVTVSIEPAAGSAVMAAVAGSASLAPVAGTVSVAAVTGTATLE